MSELINNNDSNLVDPSNNCVQSAEENRDRNKQSETRGGRKSSAVESVNNQKERGEEEEMEGLVEHTIRIPFFSIQQYKEGRIKDFDEIIGKFCKCEL